MSGQRDDRPLAHGIVKWAGCPTTGKRGYVTRSDAKRALKRGQLHADGMHPYRCQHCGNFHNGHHAGLTREDHRRGPDAPDPTWLTVDEVVRRLKPAKPAKMRAIVERLAREGRVEAMGALGVTLIHADEVARLHRAAWDTSQDERLKEIR